MMVHSASLRPTERVCATCAHWSNVEKDWQFESLVMGRCAAIRQREDIVEPARQIEDWDAREIEEGRLLTEAMAIAVDGSGYYAAVRTLADFGCALWSPADSPAPDTLDGTQASQEAGVHGEWDELERLARAATQGEWKASGRYVGTARSGNGFIAECRQFQEVLPSPSVADANAAFIAAANPQTILNLIARAKGGR